ncbi:MAG: SprB repeat-containing protein [Lewinellaceae bacterium]|nr:SprB repeat-containing protein [Lewinellaceae bacterium]
MCKGTATGSINLTVTGGTPAYSYVWSNGATVEDPSGLIAGTYTVTVTDANNCAATTSVTITEPFVLLLSTTQVNVLCYGGNNGAIDLSVSGGVSPYTYNWGVGQPTMQDRTGLVAGTYSVTVTDANGCTKTTSATITQPTELALNTTVANSTCGNANGSINLSVAGGTPGYTFLWSNGSTTEDQSGLLAGTYTVVVTDSHGCTKSTSATVNNIGGPALSTTTTPVNCYGDSNGAIDLVVTGGTTPYAYLWSNGYSGQDPSGLVAGTYTVTVTDANACSAITSATVQQPSDILLTKTVTNVVCYGGQNGMIDLTVSGGSPGYTYVWSNGYLSQDPIGLVAGTYTVTVTDSHGCTKTTTATVTQPTEITFAFTVTNLSCYGGVTGAIDLTVMGGVSPYTYIWSNGATNQDISGLSAGPYTVTVTDANACTKATTIILTQPPAVTPVISSITNVNCFGGASGAIDLSVTGGTGAYTYLWSNGFTGQDPSGLIAGTYTVIVTDANGCTGTQSAVVTQPTDIMLTKVVTNVNCYGGSNGSIDLSVAGGTPGYTYAWSNGFTGQDPSGLAAGTYTVTVTDSHGCTKVTSAVVGQPTDIVLTKVVTDANCYGSADGSINLSVSGGTPGYTYLWSNGFAGQDPNGLVAGTYTVTVTDSHGCTKTTCYRWSADGYCFDKSGHQCQLLR